MKYFLNIILAGTLALFNLFSGNLLQADDLKYSDPNNSELGRLADGQAFRKDQDGTKIVDYIAELEMSSLELNRSLNASRDEVQLLKAEVERLKSGREEFVVRETDDQSDLLACQERLKKQAANIQKLQEDLDNDQTADLRAAFSPASLKNSIELELRELLIEKDSRDVLLSQRVEFMAANPALKKLQDDPKSLSGKTISDLEEDLRQENDLQRLSDLRIEIGQIKARINEQINLLQ